MTATGPVRGTPATPATATRRVAPVVSVCGWRTASAEPAPRIADAGRPDGLELRAGGRRC